MLEHIRQDVGVWLESLEQKLERVMAPAIQWTAHSMETISRKTEEKKRSFGE